MTDRKKFSSRWSGVNSIATYESFSAEREASPITVMRWNADLQTRASRKLINETHAIFVDLQRESLTEKSPRTNLLQSSRQYRSVIQSCALELQDQAGTQTESDAQEVANTELGLFSIIEMIWHLCEIVLIDKQPGGYSLSQLLEWLKWHFTEVDGSARRLMAEDDPSIHPTYWSTIYGFIFQGRLEEAVNLLSLHPHRDRQRYDAFAGVNELLQSMPCYQVFTGQTPEEFLLHWKKWQNDCKIRLNSGEFAVYPNLEEICHVLSGDESVIDKCRDVCPTWYQFVIGKLLYTNPVFKVFDLGSHSMMAIELFGGVEQLSTLDKIILSVIDLDVHKVIKSCSECLPNWWLVTHLGDLLYHNGQLKEHQLDYGVQLREFLLLEYAASLMSHGSLWPIAADYLAACPTYGREHLEAYVAQLPLQDDKKAMKVIHLCNKYSLTEQAGTICRVMGMRALKHGRLGTALSWSLKSKDSTFASYLAEQLLVSYSQTGKFAHLDLIESLGTTMLLSNKLTFLGKYHEFHSLYRDGQLEEAGSLLVTLLTTDLAPKRFWRLLLLDALPLVEAEKAVFDTSQTYELLRCAEEMTSADQLANTHRPKQENEVSVAENEDRSTMDLVRVSLSRNLARSILNEAAM